MKLPKISIITPSFNQGKYLEETIKSVINQNYPNLEYIIIDGGSNDNSLDIIDKYKDYLSFWVSEKDEGQTQAINKGFRKATGDIVAWMNSDDLYVEGVFFKVAKLYLENPSIDVFYGDKVHIDEKGNNFFIQRYAPYSIDSFANDKMAMCNQACFWKRTVFDRIGYLDETIQFAMDYEYFVRMGVQGLKFLHVPEIFGKQRYYDGTKTSDYRWQRILKKDKIKINEKYGLKQNIVKRINTKFQRYVYYLKKGKFKDLIQQKIRNNFLIKRS